MSNHQNEAIAEHKLEAEAEAEHQAILKYWHLVIRHRPVTISDGTGAMVAGVKCIGSEPYYGPPPPPDWHNELSALADKLEADEATTLLGLSKRWRRLESECEICSHCGEWTSVLENCCGDYSEEWGEIYYEISESLLGRKFYA